MLQAGGDVYLACEAFAAYGTCEVGGEDLESDFVSVAHIAREVNCRHAAASKLALDRIAIIDDSGELR